MERKSSSWIIERSPALTASFRLHVPLPDRRDNFVRGEKRQAPSVENRRNVSRYLFLTSAGFDAATMETEALFTLANGWVAGY